MAASLGKASSEINPEHELYLAVGLRTRLRQETAIGEDNAARGVVVLVAGDLQPPRSRPCLVASAARWARDGVPSLVKMCDRWAFTVPSEMNIRSPI